MASGVEESAYETDLVLCGGDSGEAKCLGRRCKTTPKVLRIRV